MEEEDAAAPGSGDDMEQEDLYEIVPPSTSDSSGEWRWEAVLMDTADSTPVSPTLPDQQEEQFDISLPPSHSYLGEEMEVVRGSNVVGGGWRGRVPALAHSGAVFPGEPVPLLLTRAQDSAALRAALARDHHLALLCPDETGTQLSGYGVLCEVYEAAPAAGSGPLLAVKARATRRLRFLHMPTAKRPVSVQEYGSVRELEVVVLHEGPAEPPLRRLLGRGPRAGDEQLTAWPRCALACLDADRLWRAVERYMGPGGGGAGGAEDVASRSFRAAGALPLSAGDRAALLALGCPAARLLAAARRLRGGALCCAGCGAELARQEQEVAMSAAGAHAHYANPGGFVHAVVTVAAARVALRGRPSGEYSWFPGYAWTAAQCGGCGAHVGWRFTALRPALRPRTFYGLCRNYLAPEPEPVSSPDTSPTYNDDYPESPTY